MVDGNRVPAEEEIRNPGPDVAAESNPDPLGDEYRRTVGFQPQDGSDQRTQQVGYDRSLGYDRIAVGNTPMALRIDNITNLLAAGERSAGNLQEVNRFYGRAQKEADDLFAVAGQNVMKGREDYRAILAAKSPEEVFQGVNQSIQKQAQALQLQLQQEQDPARQRRLTQLLAMEQDRLATLDRMTKTKNPQELDRLLTYDAFSAQRIDLGHKMMNERDPNQVRLMAEAEMNLHTVQRGPGFTRANYGMLMMRLGHYDPSRPDNVALRAMQDAASVDPEMIPNPNSPDPARRMGDPNFMRVAADITRMRPDDPNFAQVMAPIFNKDINRSPAPLMATEQNYNPNARYSQVQEQPYQPARDGSNPQLEQSRVTDQSQGVTPQVNGKTPLQRAQELGKVAEAQGLTPDVRQAYAACIQDSDKGTSPRVAELQAQLAQLEQRFTQRMQEVFQSPEISQLDQQITAKVKTLPEAEQQRLGTLKQQLEQTQDKAEREKVIAEIGKTCPEFVQMMKLIDEKYKPVAEEFQQIQQLGAALSRELIGEMNQSSATRMEYAEKLMKSDKPEDKALAKQLLIESVAKAKPEQRQDFAKYAMQLGLSQQELEQGLARIPQPEVQRAGVQPGVETASGERSAAGKLIDENRKAFDAAQDKKAKLAEMQGSFQKAIVDSDKEFADLDIGAAYNQLSEARAKALNDMPADDKAKLQKLLTEGTPAPEKEAIQKELAGKYASIDQMAMQMQALEGTVVDSAVGKFEARYEFARASSLGGDDANAKKLMEDGIKTLTKDAGPAITAKVLEDPGVAELAKKLGVDANALVQAVVAELPQQQPGDQTNPAANNLENTLQVADARMQKGDVAGAKQAYESAIKMVDASFNPEQNNAKIKAAQDALESGNLTLDQRYQKQQEVAGYFEQAVLAYEIRKKYAQLLSHPAYKQNAAAEVAFKDAVAAADRVPVAAMKRQMAILANDTSTFQTAFEQASKEKQPQIEGQQAWLTKFTNILNGQTTGGGAAADQAWMNTQINARKSLAAFYVTLVTDVDEKGKPLLKSDGTPIYVADASQVFKPAEGMKAIDEAKAKYKELYGADLDADPAKDPTLAILAKGIYDNSPAELQKKYKNVSVFWDEAKASVPTMIAGVGTALLLAKYMPFSRVIGKSGVATWGSSLLAGSAVGTVTHHTIMNNVLGRTDNSWEHSLAIGTGTTLGGVGLFKTSGFVFRNFGDDAAAQIIKRGGGGPMELGAVESGVSRIKTLDVLKQERALATLADDQARLDGLIRANENRTGLMNMLAGPKGKQIAEFDQSLQALSGGGKSKLVSDLGSAIDKFKPQLKVAEGAPEFASKLGERGGMIVPKELADKFAANGVTVIEKSATESVLAMRTPAEMKKVLLELPEIEPTLLGGARNTSQAKKITQAMNAELDAMVAAGVSADANLASALAKATLKNPEQINMLTAFVPEAAAAAKQVSGSGANLLTQQGLFASAGTRMLKASEGTTGFQHRLLSGAGNRLVSIGDNKALGTAQTFASTVTSGKGALAIGATTGFGSEAYNYTQTGEFSLANAGLKSVLVAGGLYGVGKVGRFAHSSAVNAINAERVVAADGFLASTGNRMIANAESATGLQAKALNGTGHLLRGTEKTARFGTSGLGATTIGTTAGFGSEAYNYTQTGEFSLGNAAVKSVLFAGGLYGVGKGGQIVNGLFKPWGAKTVAELNHARFLAGTAAGATYYAGSAYPREWQLMYGSDGNIDRTTGKPYELNFRNAVLSPAWKSEHDNIFVASLLGGGFFAKPGATVMAQAPWANSGRVMKLPTGFGHLFTGNTWNYWGSRGAALPLVGEAVPAITTNMSVRQFDLINSASNMNAGKQYLDAIEKADDNLTDDSPEEVQKRIQLAQKQLEQQRLQQQQQQEQQKKQGNEPGAVNQPRPENTDLTGGVQ